MSTAAVPATLETWRRPLTSTSVRAGPRLRKSSRLMPTCPGCARDPAVRFAVMDETSAGVSASSSVRLTWPDRTMTSCVTVVIG